MANKSVLHFGMRVAATIEMPTSRESFQILALDGGGMKGLFAAAVLARLEEDLGITISDHFDLITGTSTGGIIALGLGLGFRPREIVEFYVNFGPRIFPKSRWRTIRHLFATKYEHNHLIEALKGTFGEKLLGDSRKRLVVPAYNLGQDHVRLFKTPHHPRLTRDWKIPAWKVALATTAAPTYFPSCREIDSQRLIDGGVWANNPTLVGIIEAKRLLNIPLDGVSVLSVGTCDEVTRPSVSLDKGGFWLWKREAIRVIMRGQSVGTNNLACLLLGEDYVRRIDPNVPVGIYSLDKVSTDELVAEAGHASLHFSPTFEKYFRQHVASQYNPCLQVCRKE